jgi:hypothetical protein
MENRLAWQLARWLARRTVSVFLAASIVALVPSLLAGCGVMHVRAGKKPDTGALQKSLHVGRSTEQQVRALLGDPDGRGRSMLPWQASPRTVWSYYYEEGVIDLGGGNSDDRRIFLYVFFDGDRFDGYMWFSSLKP